MVEVVRVLRAWMQVTGDAALGLEGADRALLASGTIEAGAWYPYAQYLRLIGASFERSCAGDWRRLHELCAAGVARICERGYEPLLRRRALVPALSATSVLWRASYDFGYALAETDASGATVCVTDWPGIGRLAGQVNAGWCLGVARSVGASVARLELRRRPWAGEGDEQMIRLHWSEREQEPVAELPGADGGSGPGPGPVRAILC